MEPFFPVTRLLRQYQVSHGVFTSQTELRANNSVSNSNAELNVSSSVVKESTHGQCDGSELSDPSLLSGRPQYQLPAAHLQEGTADTDIISSY